MRASIATLALFCIFLFLATSVSAMRRRISDIRSPNPTAVSVPYKWCGNTSDDATLSTITANEYPPVPEATFILNIQGNLSKTVTSGTFEIDISVDGVPVPGISGDLSQFATLPWQAGALNVTYSIYVPSEAPSGSYIVQMSAVDQDTVQIFCFALSFNVAEHALDSGSSLGMGEAEQTEVGRIARKLAKQLPAAMWGP